MLHQKTSQKEGEIQEAHQEQLNLKMTRRPFFSISYRDHSSPDDHSDYYVTIRIQMTPHDYPVLKLNPRLDLCINSFQN